MLKDNMGYVMGIIRDIGNMLLFVWFTGIFEIGFLLFFSLTKIHVPVVQ